MFRVEFPRFSDSARDDPSQWLIQVKSRKNRVGVRNSTAKCFRQFSNSEDFFNFNFVISERSLSGKMSLLRIPACLVAGQQTGSLILSICKIKVDFAQQIPKVTFYFFLQSFVLSALHHVCHKRNSWRRSQLRILFLVRRLKIPKLSPENFSYFLNSIFQLTAFVRLS